ncbi:type I secretion system permease/ATPase [Sphingomonas jatrophae]|uniref:ATP-binding cassette, subfamily C n=1 Tax=Sphingomonas jatrophae TaxID=1166337 RepID=A0A1I6JS23_9SPHN|nr:type I secretion system permease/ATPase [Sphingomonas jatrophae]SFR81784.1 ATP-binding cassette, subfamily C [Sphingomonas jatrophae]
MRAAFARCRRHVAAAAGFSALVNLLYIAPTLYMLQVYDRVVPTQGELTLLFLTLILLFGLVTLSLLDRVRSRLLVRAGVLLDAVLAPTLLDATLRRPDAPTARAALREFDALRVTLTGPGILALFDAPWTPIYVLLCFLIHPWLGVLALVGGGVLAAIAWRNERATRGALEKAQSAATGAYAAQEALLGGADAVRALGMRRAMVSRQLRAREAMMTQQTDAGFAAGNYLTASKFVRLALQSLALGTGALLAIDNKISGGAIFAASFLIARALSPIEQLIGSWRSLVLARDSWLRLDRLLAGSVVTAEPTRLPAPRGDLVVEGVTLFNDTRDGTILSDISLRIAAGEVVAIVGPSGAGKSTLARIVAAASVADRGLVRLDGAALGDWDPEQLARHIGYLPQEPSLFAGTIKENIARFRGELGEDAAELDAAVIAAAEMARARELIQHLKGGFDYTLRPGGGGLSAGQAQRVALARAMFGDPALLVLDEPNAHLDSEGDQALVAAIDHYKKQGHTVLIVSHKLSILPVVDKLVVMRGGRVELFGPRDEVLAKIAPPRPRPVGAPVGQQVANA